MYVKELQEILSLTRTHLQQEYKPGTLLECSSLKTFKPKAPIVKPPPPKKIEMRVEPTTTKPVEKSNFASIRQMLEKAAPNTKIVDSVPCDAKAKEQKIFVPDVPIITFQNHPEGIAFLKKIAQAITSLGRSTSIITVPTHDKLKKILNSHDVKLILIDREPLTHDAILAPLYRHDDQHHYLNHIPIYPMPPIKQLMQNPQEKARLWNEMQTRLK